jgi:hypothetical protein
MSPRTALVGAALLVAAPWLAAAATTDTTAVSARWQKHELTFDYHAFTSFYTCNGLEDKVRQILLLFGARKGAKVNVTGCPQGPDTPTSMAWVRVQFESLGDGGRSGGADTVPANWQPVELRPNRPTSMGQGECEIVEKLKPVLTAGFDLQDLEYRTSCTPHQIGLNDYGVRGKVLQPIQK